MSREVNGVLAERARHGRNAGARSFLAALALHGLVLALVLLAPRLKSPPPPLEFVPVQIIPAQALGVRRPAPPRRKTPPAPAAETAAPEKQPEAAPAQPQPADDVPALPDPDRKKKKEDPKPPVPARETPAPNPDKGAKPRQGAQGEEGQSGTVPGATGDERGRRGGPQGNPLGTTAFGSEVGVLDNPDFTYAYYLDRMLTLINDKWERPSMGSGIKAVLFFRISRNGRMSDLQVEQSSGYNSFDLAALRAVQNAAPFPPLPRAYKNEDLGVHLIVR